MQFGPLLPLLMECKKKIVVCQGGGDSLKTTSILQNLSLKHTQEPRIKTTVTGRDLPKIKGGPLETWNRYAKPDVVPYMHKWNESSLTAYFKNYGAMEFKAFEDEDDATGSERDYLFCNEIPMMPYMMFWQLQRKTNRQVFVDYNPTSRFWIHERVLPFNEDGTPNPNQEPEFKDQVALFITDHRHNPFLTEARHRSYELIKDPELFKVYARGKTGKTRGLIYGHMKKMSSWEETTVDGVLYINGVKVDRVCWGIDYGYTNDPTAIVKIMICGRVRYIRECAYTPGLSAEQIEAVFIAYGWTDEELIHCDIDNRVEAGATDMTNQLRMKGLPAYPAVKAVAPGIAKVREMECYYYSDSKCSADPAISNYEKEVTSYRFMEGDDVITGKVIMLNRPEDTGWDHLMAATRYGIYSDTFRYPDEA